ncbi:MAG: hypothetical protein IH588_01375 [Anaerolineales bacterium]|nr:hypothetical protein [Anaerolineales bacterium]
MFKNGLTCLWKLFLCAFAFYGGTMLGGMAASMLGLPAPEMPAGADQMVLGQVMLLISLILAGTLAILSRNLSGGFVGRWLTISLLVWIAYGVNNILEGAIFTTMSAASLFTVVLYIIASLLCGAAAAWLFPPSNKGDDFLLSAKNFFARHTTASWTWRILAALLAFPLIYLSFGRLIAPFVMEFYEQGLFDLTLPTWGQILPVVLVRSLLFLLACLPVLILLQSSSRRTFWVLGLTLFLLVGGLSMLQAYWLPAELRLIHSLEILADELVYAGILVVLFKLPATAK